MKNRIFSWTAFCLVCAGYLLLVPTTGCEQNDYVKRQEVERQEVSDPEPVAPGKMIVE